MSTGTNEIGGYLGLETFSGIEYYQTLVSVNSARNALLYILKARRIKKLYIPRFLCDTVSQLCMREDYPYEEYSITASFLPVFDRPLAPGEYLYIVNFYGQISNAQILEMKERWKNIIVDNVQAFFQKPVSGVDTVYSCRKFFGVPDGGYAATDAVMDEPLPRDLSADRMTHILGRFEEGGSKYYSQFQQNDERFYELELRSMSALTHNLLRAVDYEAACRKREVNYAILEKALGPANRLKLSTPVGPYCYPFYCENGLEVKRKLAAEKIYVATLWPNVLQSGNALERDYAANILPLPCDQRYGKEQMERIIREVMKCIG